MDIKRKVKKEKQMCISRLPTHEKAYKHMAGLDHS